METNEKIILMVEETCEDIRRVVGGMPTSEYSRISKEIGWEPHPSEDEIPAAAGDSPVRAVAGDGRGVGSTE